MKAERGLGPGLLATLGFISAVGPLAIDMYLPAFTQIGDDLGVPASSVQLTLTAFLLGIGTGQLVLGAASDRFGRRPVLRAAITVFAITSLALVFVPTIGLFIALRFVQGFAGSAGVVLARAIAADLSVGATAVRALSLIAMVVSLGPLIAPPLGGLVASFAGWRGVLGVLAVVSLVMMALAFTVVPESLPPERRHSGGIRGSLDAYAALLRRPSYVLFVIVFALAFAVMMAYVSASPFVGQIVLGMPPLLYAAGFSAGAAALIIANVVNARIAPRVGPARMLVIGVSLLLAATGLLVTLVLAGALSAPVFIAVAFAVSGGAGLVMSNGSALALSHAVEARGAGAALLGASQFLIGGLVTPIVGLGGEHTALPMAVVMFTAAALAVGIALAAVRRKAAD